MSQQELFPGPQENEKQSYYYTPPTQRRENEPKEEHPSLFTGEIPPYTYQAQDRVIYRNHTDHKNQQAHMNSSQREVPSWARPQQHRGMSIWRVLIACGVILLAIKLVPLLIIGVLALLGTAFVIVLSVFIVVGLLLLFALLGLLILVGIPLLRLVSRGRP